MDNASKRTGLGVRVSVLLLQDPLPVDLLKFVSHPKLTTKTERREGAVRKKREKGDIRKKETRRGRGNDQEREREKEERD